MGGIIDTAQYRPVLDATRNMQARINADQAQRFQEAPGPGPTNRPSNMDTSGLGSTKGRFNPQVMQRLMELRNTPMPAGGPPGPAGGPGTGAGQAAMQEILRNTQANPANMAAPIPGAAQNGPVTNQAILVNTMATYAKDQAAKKFNEAITTIAMHPNVDSNKAKELMPKYIQAYNAYVEKNLTSGSREEAQRLLSDFMGRVLSDSGERVSQQEESKRSSYGK